jgi:hypothetical protein
MIPRATYLFFTGARGADKFSVPSQEIAACFVPLRNAGARSRNSVISRSDSPGISLEDRVLIGCLD